jgi:hypothetical protein
MTALMRTREIAERGRGVWDEVLGIERGGETTGECNVEPATVILRVLLVSIGVSARHSRGSAVKALHHETRRDGVATNRFNCTYHMRGA